MEWKIKPITEEEINNYFEKVWNSLTDAEKNYMREMHMTICVSNSKWRTELAEIAKLVFKREDEKDSDKPFSDTNNNEAALKEADGVEIDTEESEPKPKKAKYKMLQEED